MCNSHSNPSSCCTTVLKWSPGVYKVTERCKVGRVTPQLPRKPEGMHKVIPPIFPLPPNQGRRWKHGDIYEGSRARWGRHSLRLQPWPGSCKLRRTGSSRELRCSQAELRLCTEWPQTGSGFSISAVTCHCL